MIFFLLLEFWELPHQKKKILQSLLTRRFFSVNRRSLSTINEFFPSPGTGKGNEDRSQPDPTGSVGGSVEKSIENRPNETWSDGDLGSIQQHPLV